MSSISSYYNNITTDLISNVYGSSKSSSTYKASSNSNLLSSVYGKNTASGLSSEMQSYVSTLKTTGSSLKTLMEKLSGNSSKNNLYNQKTIAPSDSDVLSITSKGSVSGTLKDTTVTVKQTAAAQVNEGTALSKNALTIGTGSKSMKITGADGKGYTFSVNPLITQTNEKVQNDLAEKINKANIGVTAKVEVDSKTNTSKLVLTSSKTGENTAFTVSGNLAEAFGVSEVTTKAQNAVYTVNGTQKTSQSNDIDINGVSMTLKSASDKAVTFTEKNDYTNLVNSVRDMVNQYNQLLEAAGDNSEGDSGANRLYQSLQSLAKTYESSLSKAGISINKNGYLEIDSEKMTKAAESGDLQKLAGQGNGYKSYGFASRLEQMASKMSENPLSYVSTAAKNEANKNSQGSYYTSGNLSMSYISMYNRHYNTGMLLDMLF